MEYISKSKFKAHALEILREIEQSGETRIITDRGKPTLEVRKLRQKPMDPLIRLKNSVLKYDAATEPVGDDDWENA